MTCGEPPRISPRSHREGAGRVFGRKVVLGAVCGLIRSDTGIGLDRHHRYVVDEAKSDPAGEHVSLSKVLRHDWASHAADAFRTAAVMIREPERKKEQEKRRPAGKLSPWS
jgi:hypothetical protein